MFLSVLICAILRVPVKILESKKVRGSRKSDKEILAYIQEKGLVERSDVVHKYGSHKDSILRELVRNGRIFTFSLKKGGNSNSPFSAEELFDGFAMNRHYYVDERRAADLIIKKLDLSPDMSHDEKHSTTLYLRRCLPLNLFHLVYGAYGDPHSTHWLRQPNYAKVRVVRRKPMFSEEQFIAVLKTISHPATTGEVSDALGIKNPEVGKRFVRRMMHRLIEEGKVKKVIPKTGGAKQLYALQ